MAFWKLLRLLLNDISLKISTTHIQTLRHRKYLTNSFYIKISSPILEYFTWFSRSRYYDNVWRWNDKTDAHPESKRRLVSCKIRNFSPRWCTGRRKWFPLTLWSSFWRILYWSVDRCLDSTSFNFERATQQILSNLKGFALKVPFKSQNSHLTSNKTSFLQF